MRIRLKLFAGLRALRPQDARTGGEDLDLPDGTTVAQALAKVKVPLDEAKIVLVNGRHAKFDTPLKEGDRLSVFPPVGGG